MLNRLRIFLHLGCFAPLVWLAIVLMSSDESALGADPVKELVHFLGKTALVIFCLSFLVGIYLRNRPHFLILRRPLGLWAFVWVLLHITSYLFLELAFDGALFLREVVQRPYLILGGVAFVILALLTISSLPSLKVRLGKQWFRLHQWSYVALLAAIVHYYWSVKSLTLQPILMAIVVCFILWNRWQRA